MMALSCHPGCRFAHPWLRWLALGLSLVLGVWCLTPVQAAGVENPAAFGWCCIRPECDVPRSHPAGMLSRHALAERRITTLGATRNFCHGLPVGAQSRSDQVFEQILDQYVRDGFVYYAALRAERHAIDQYVESLAERPAGFDAWSETRRLAYWLNGYNALVLRTVIDHYPIRGTSIEFPEDSVLQIPGVFSGREHRIAGRRLTLQAIEEELITTFRDPRAHLALARGAVGSPRLRNEAFSDERLEAQLQAVVADFATTPRHVTLDRAGDNLVVSAVLGWQAEQFAALAEADGTGRSSIERAIVALISPVLFPTEREFLARNTFRLYYREFDWRLNDLTGGAPVPRQICGSVWPGRGGRDASFRFLIANDSRGYTTRWISDSAAR